jgi:hypothetical protein
MREGKGSLKMGGNNKKWNSRDDRALKRATIVEKWWRVKIKKAARQSEKLRKEGGSGEVEERQMEIIAKDEKTGMTGSQRLNEREVQRERSP